TALGLSFQSEQGADKGQALGGAARVAVAGRLEVACGMAPAANLDFRMFCIRIGEKAAIVGRVGIDLDVTAIVGEEGLRVFLALVQAEIDDDVGMRLVA